MSTPILYRPRTAKLVTLASLVALVVASSTVPATHAASSMKPVAVVAVTSVNQLLEDINFIGSLGGQPRLADQVRPFIGFVQGVDHDRPIGLIVQSDEVTPSGALCLPVKDFQMLLGGLAMFNVTHEPSDQGPEGTYEIGAQGQTLYAREADGWAFLSMTPQMLEDLPDNPTALLGKLTEEYDFGIQLNVQNVPQEFRNMAIEQLQQGMQAGMNKLPKESDEDFEARKKMTTMQVDQIKRVINEMDKLTFGLSIDSDQKRTLMDIVYSAVEGTELADQVAQYSDAKTNYAGFLQPDAAMMMSFAAKVTESDAAQIEQMFVALRAQIKSKVDECDQLPTDEARETAKSAIDDFIDAYIETVKAGIMDGGAVVNLAPNALSMVAGGFVGDPSKFESGLRKLADAAKDDPNFKGVHWNSDSHADVQFHTFSVPIPEDEEEPRQLFGEQVDVAFGIGAKSAFMAFGRDCIDAVKRVIDDSAATPEKSVPPMEMSLSLQQIMEVVASFAEGDKKEKMQAIADMLASESTGRDHVRIISEATSAGIRSRFELEEGVLRAVGFAAMQSQMAGADAGF